MIQVQFSISAQFAMFCRELSRLLAREQPGLTRDCAFHCMTKILALAAVLMFSASQPAFPAASKGPVAPTIRPFSF
jgi:hypothetical protein